MIKSFIATTCEIDDPQMAVEEIISSLDIENNLLKNSIGIISCFSEFCDTGVLEAVCNTLPFDCVGATTCLCSSNNETDQVIMSVTVLTSDDCLFKAAKIDITDDYDTAISDGLAAFFEGDTSLPAVMLSFFPLMNTISGDMMLSSIDKATGGVPLFGTAAVDHNMDYSTSATIYNGNGFREALTFCAIYGNPNISYEVASLDESKIRSQKAIITESNGNILIGVNGKTALEYLEEIGLTKNELATGLGIVPLIVDHKDGTKPVARAVFALTPEGHAVCGGAMPVNATLGIGQVSTEDVLMTTEQALTPLIQEDSVVLSYSCMARYLALGADSTAEAEKISTILKENHYLFACSGGEICPLPDATGKLKNFYHNYTIVLCRIS